MNYIRRSNGGIMEVDDPNEPRKKAVWDASPDDEPFSISKSLNFIKLSNSKYYQNKPKLNKNLLKPNTNNSSNEGNDKTGLGKGPKKEFGSWKFSFKKLFKFNNNKNKEKANKLETELEAKMKLTNEEAPPTKSIINRLFTSFYSIMASIAQHINFNTILTIITVPILLTLTYHMYKDYNKIYQFSTKLKIEEREEAIIEYGVHCADIVIESGAKLKAHCDELKIKMDLSYLVVNRTRIWVELIVDLINHFFDNLTLKTIIILTCSVILISTLSNLKGILSLGQFKKTNDEPREVKHVLYFENYQNPRQIYSSGSSNALIHPSSRNSKTLEGGVGPSSSKLMSLSSY